MTSTARPTAEAAHVAPETPQDNPRQTPLKDYRIGSSPERTFDRITALASKILGVPMAFISFLERDTQFFKSCFGLDLKEMPSEGSFCSYAAKGDEIMVVPDARSDRRFAHHPLVTGEPYVRFYAGAPLSTPTGVTLGTLCLLDHEPHPVFGNEQRDLLSDLADVVMAALERRRLSAAVVRERAFLEAVLDNVADGVVACNAEGELTLFNQAARTFHGLPASPLEPGNWALHYDLYEADGSTPLATERIPLFRALLGENVQNADMVIATENAPARQLQANARPFSDQQGELLGAVVAMRDVTAERAAAAALRESEALHRTVLGALREGVVQQEADGRISSHNPAAERILGLSADELLGRTSADPRWQAVYEDGSPYPAAEHPPMRALRTGAVQQGAVMGVRKPSGSLSWLLINAQPLFRAEQREPYAVVTSFTDITHLKHVESELRHAALHDTLTGLASRTLLNDRLERAAARADRNPEVRFALLFIDLDGFKTVNDTLGHVVGDEVLVRVAATLKARVRESDTVARFGGDEFAVLLEGLKDARGAVKFAESILGDLSFSVPAESGELFISASIGIAFSDRRADTHGGIRTLLERADAAMYRAKTAGKAQIVLAEGAL